MCYVILMRTTLELDDDLHATAKELAEKKRRDPRADYFGFGPAIADGKIAAPNAK